MAPQKDPERCLLFEQAHPSSWLPSSSLEATDPFNLTNFALALLLAFRLDASYSRYMEGRRIWGNIVADSRNLVRQVPIMCGPVSLAGTHQLCTTPPPPPVPSPSHRYIGLGQREAQITFELLFNHA